MNTYLRLVFIQDQYLAITHDNGYYMELSTEDYLHCSGNELKKCPYNYLIREVFVQPSCIVGLFLKNLDIISKQCEHTIIQHKSNYTLSRVLSLNNGSYLIGSPDTAWTQTCQGILSIKGCNLCVVKVECNCLISSKSFVILPHLHSCLTNNF
jgi:hypothetical protein